MDIATLEALGVNKEDLAERIVGQAVHALLYSTGYGEDEEESTYASKFKSEIERRVKDAVDAKINALAQEHVIPRVGELIEQTDMRKTNSYGEPKSPSMTFKEYIADRAAIYMTEDVDSQGRSKAESTDSYNFRIAGPRLTVLMKMYIRDSMETAAKGAVNDVNKVIAKNIAKAATDAISTMANSISVTVSAK